MADIALSSYSSPAHSLGGASLTPLVVGSNVTDQPDDLALDYSATTGVSASSALAVALGSSVGDQVAAMYLDSQAAVTPVRLRPSEGGSPAVPTTGQIFPRGNG